MGDTTENEIKKAIAAAMRLLLYRQRTEQELRQKLTEKEFSREAVDAAVSYVTSYGYLNDKQYAEVYLRSMAEKKSRSRIRYELLEKGVDASWIEAAFSEEPDKEEEIVYNLLCKKAGAPHPMDEKELRRTTAYLARRGFSSSTIWKNIRKYQDTSS